MKPPASRWQLVHVGGNPWSPAGPGRRDWASGEGPSYQTQESYSPELLLWRKDARQWEGRGLWCFMALQFTAFRETVPISLYAVKIENSGLFEPMWAMCGAFQKNAIKTVFLVLYSEALNVRKPLAQIRTFCGGRNALYESYYVVPQRNQHL